MEMTLESLGLDKLTPQDKQLVAQLLWESIEGPILPLSESFRIELDRRAKDHELHPEDGIPWEQVKPEARARLGY